LQIIKSIQKMQSLASELREQSKTIGFVPTMGFLHEGHLSLMRIARNKCGILVVSLFVNPTQFGNDEDLDKYPHDFERDQKLCKQEDVDIIFSPNVDEMYPDSFFTYVDVTGEMTDVLCGKFRPEHFRGVTTVVAKLFNIIRPHISVFGQKDGQQLAVVKRMACDLNFPVEIIAGPTVRESDGLAMSSRNKYLSPEERTAAPILHQSLLFAKELIDSGERDSNRIIAMMRKLIEKKSLRLKIQYIAIVDAETLEPLEQIRAKIMVALAVFLGNTRLIDNVIIEVGV